MGLPQLVIFDCDGVLVDTESLGNRRLASWLTEAGFPIEYEACRRRFVGRSMAAVQAEVEAAGVSLGVDFVERWNLALPELFAKGVDEIPHVREFVETLREARIPYCVASSARLSKMHITLGVTGMLPLFKHAMFSSTMVARGKPFPDLFLHAADTMGFAPADCIVIEDSVAGTEAGRAAGMPVYSYCADAMADSEGLAAAGGVLFDDFSHLSAMIGVDQLPAFAASAPRR